MANAQGSELSSFRQSFSDYQKNQTKSKRKSKEDVLAKYFVPRKTKEVFRILPYKTAKFHVDVFFHVVSTNIAGGKKKHGTVIYCPAHNDPRVQKVVNGVPQVDGNGKPLLIPAPCPLCDRAKKLLAKQDPSLKGIKKDDMNTKQLEINESNKKIFAEASKWEAKKFYIVRGIDKGHESDGVKFWRFKHNFKNQGTLDSLYPILDEFITINGVSFADAQNGTDLSITMADTDFNGHPYKTISAISARGKSPLSTDPIVAKQWLEDDITWRDVFKPKQAPGMPPFEFLESVANGTNPYWEDTDGNNKHWVFPGRPDLEQAANTRKQNLDGDENENFEYASDIEDGQRVTISNVSASTVGTPVKEDAVEMTASTNTAVEEDEDLVGDADVENAPSGDYEDLPF